jgi:hypothetical protein
LKKEQEQEQAKHGEMDGKKPETPKGLLPLPDSEVPKIIKDKALKQTKEEDFKPKGAQGLEVCFTINHGGILS